MTLLRSVRSWPLALGVALAVLLASAGPVCAGVGDYSCADASKVYFGNHRLFQRPCEISSDRVYQHIPEYREILRRGLTDKDPRYHLLMKKASKRFNAAVRKMARAKNHDLAAEIGAVRKVNKKAADVVARTDDVIKALD